MQPRRGEAAARRGRLSAEAASFVPTASDSAMSLGCAADAARFGAAADGPPCAGPGERAAAPPAYDGSDESAAALHAAGAAPHMVAAAADEVAPGMAWSVGDEAETEDGRDRVRLGSAARRNARRRRLVNRVKSERDGLEGFVAALTRSFVPVPVAVPVLPLQPPHVAPHLAPYHPALPVAAHAAAARAAAHAQQEQLLSSACAAPVTGPGPPGVAGAEFAALCTSRAVLALPPISISHAHAAQHWHFLPALGPLRPHASHDGAAAAVEVAVRGAVTSAFQDAHTDCVLWAVALDQGVVRWVSDNVTAALGHAPATLVGQPYMADSCMEDNLKFLSEVTLMLETQGELRCMPRRLFRRRHALGHELLVSCAGAMFVQDPASGELLGLVANRIVAALR